MTYPYENLSPEKFQQFCQALLVRQFPKTQCLPVGQPDGGRDGISPSPSVSGQFVVFQVKFVRNPNDMEDPHKWLTGVVEEEAPKIETLIPKGATEYRILTNVPGTAHPDAGSVDKVRQILAAHLSIPSECWWRDDLDRRLDDAWDLKWSYPELMTGPDLIRSLVQVGLTEHQERRAMAIRAFVTAQHALDEEVRFKQVELQNKLLELFIDVPITPRYPEAKSVRIHQSIVEGLGESAVASMDDLAPRWTPYIDRHFAHYRPDIPSLGASAFLLHPLASHIPKLVLEGAPGQGKSTIVQYVCQVHRMQLLGLQPELGQVPGNHKKGPLRIPIKVDLRDFAAWLIQKDPFSPTDSDVPPTLWQRSLESFLAFLISHLSGGIAFAVDDLIAVARLSSLLLVFDGLDEVAEISRRREVVDEITKGLKRLNANCAALQAIVTSRPAAFANSPGFSEEEFRHYHLEAVTKELIGEYAEKWLKARRLVEREATEVKQILSEKLGEPHIRELAKNPMQLTILLSLIHTRGTSLPDKRTALYDSYIDLFFSRESAKSQLVRDHRDLLIDIHRYLAWVLHSEAEQGYERGSVSSDRLQRLLTDYLCAEGQDPLLAAQLFAGMVERVVAVVSRVEGTYEFEVQPLREYFAARYLYDTAPYSPPGSERRGTKPDRFDAIARNFYWLNVARFYAGCFSKGELASLVDRIQELVAEQGFASTRHPRSLAITLLSDWVFTQHPKLVKQVLELALNGPGLRLLLAPTERYGRSIPAIALPKKCGGDLLVERCLQIARGAPPKDYSPLVLEAARASGTRVEMVTFWLESAASHGDGRQTGDWVRYGDILGVLEDISLKEMESLFCGVPLDRRAAVALMLGGRSDFVEADERRCELVADAVLDGSWTVLTGASILSRFARALDPRRYAKAFGVTAPVSLAKVWQDDPSVDSIDAPEPSGGAQNDTLNKCLQTLNAAASYSSRPVAQWAAELGPWSDLVEECRTAWGDRLAFFAIANVAAGIRSAHERASAYTDLVDSSQPLCKRSRYARLRAGSTAWWRRQLSAAATSRDSILVGLTLLTWGSAATLASVCEPLQSLLDNMAEPNWLALIRSLRLASGLVRERIPRGSLTVQSLPLALSPRIATVFANRSKRHVRQQLYTKYLSDYKGSDGCVLLLCQEQALDIPNIGTSRWSPNLEVVASTYAQGAISAACQQLWTRPYAHRSPSSVKHCELILAQPERFPISMVGYAERVCRNALAERIRPVAEVANKEGWFTQPSGA